MNTNKQSPLISRAAAIFIGICFFLPWITVSCSDLEITASGWELATGVQQDGQTVDEEQAEGDAKYFLVPVVAIVVLGASFLALTMARMVYFGAGAIGIGFMIWVYMDFQSQVQDAAQQGFVISLTYQLGWWLTILGFGAVLVAGYFAGTDINKEAEALYEARSPSESS